MYLPLGSLTARTLGILLRLRHSDTFARTARYLENQTVIAIRGTFSRDTKVIIGAVDGSKEPDCDQTWEWWRETIG